ncbi:hypothetical protein F7725_011909 [Dissostichus mawsoni]|uniref:Uncharacterized protein n=1 Tax=Dissostichus mawsoni TaxID=36200 RepID=A0A7J5ZEC1_DISMA|nr:hypothetical protein F7725_011909 [Dissostichus mawsoni]
MCFFKRGKEQHCLSRDVPTPDDAKPIYDTVWYLLTLDYISLMGKEQHCLSRDVPTPDDAKPIYDTVWYLLTLDYISLMLLPAALSSIPHSQHYKMISRTAVIRGVQRKVVLEEVKEEVHEMRIKMDNGMAKLDRGGLERVIVFFPGMDAVIWAQNRSNSAQFSERNTDLDAGPAEALESGPSGRMLLPAKHNNTKGMGVNTNRSVAQHPPLFNRAGSNSSRDGVTWWESVTPPSLELPFRAQQSTTACTSSSSPAAAAASFTRLADNTAESAVNEPTFKPNANMSSPEKDAVYSPQGDPSVHNTLAANTSQSRLGRWRQEMPYDRHGERERGPDVGFIRLFLLGKNDGELGLLQQKMLEAESRRYHDIIQQDFLDSYKNLTYKTLMGMNWVAIHCPEAGYVMKTDSDMFVNTENLVYKLLRPEQQLRKNYFTGNNMRNFAPNRNKDSKWYMPPELYPGDKYPTFCSGTGYVFSGDLAMKIYRASLRIRHLQLEDVYVGVCLAKLRIEPTPPPNEFLFNHWRVSYSSCKMVVLVPHPLSADNVSGHIHFCVHEAPLLQGDVIVQICFDDISATIPDLVSLHDALFVALQTGGQALLIQTHSLFILKRKPIAAAATAVLMDVPGTTLLRDELTSTATTKRLATGTTFWGQDHNTQSQGEQGRVECDGSPLLREPFDLLYHLSTSALLQHGEQGSGVFHADAPLLSGSVYVSLRAIAQEAAQRAKTECSPRCTGTSGTPGKLSAG